MKIHIASAVALLAAATHIQAQDFSYIVHKPTGYKFHSCSATDGTAVVAAASSDTSDCAQWNQVPTGDFFHIQNRASGKYIRPDGTANGAPIVVQPNTWTGNWTQWSLENRGDGFGHIINRATGSMSTFQPVQKVKPCNNSPRLGAGTILAGFSKQ